MQQKLAYAARVIPGLSPWAKLLLAGKLLKVERSCIPGKLSRSFSAHQGETLMSVAKKPVAPVAAKTIEATAEKVVNQVVSNTQAATAAVGDLMKPFSEMQEKVRANAEKGIEQLRTHYASLKGNAESATDKLEESVAAAHAGTKEFNRKVVDLFRAQTNAGFEHMQSLFSVKTVADALKLQQDFAKTQVEALQAQSKELADIAKKVATDIVEPVKATMVLPFKR